MKKIIEYFQKGKVQKAELIVIPPWNFDLSGYHNSIHFLFEQISQHAPETQEKFSALMGKCIFIHASEDPANDKYKSRITVLYNSNTTSVSEIQNELRRVGVNTRENLPP